MAFVSFHCTEISRNSELHADTDLLQWQMFYSVGSFIAYWINFACQKHVEKLGEWGRTLKIYFCISYLRDVSSRLTLSFWSLENHISPSPAQTNTLTTQTGKWL